MHNGTRLAQFNSHPRHFEHAPHVTLAPLVRLTVALSSQAGSGALSIADQLATELQVKALPTDPPWKVFHKSFMMKVLEEHRLPAHLAKFLPEDANGPVTDVLDELFGLHPPSSVIVQQSVETMLRLARAGQVVLVGWGANVVTAKLPNVFQVRLVGSLERRLERIRLRERLGRKQALAWITRQDRGRARYVKHYFGQDPTEPALYHLTINTDRFTDAEAARLIAETALGRSQFQAPAHSQFAHPG